MYVYMYIYMSLHMSLYMYMSMPVSIAMAMSMSLYMYMFMQCMGTCIRVCILICTRTCICSYVGVCDSSYLTQTGMSDRALSAQRAVVWSTQVGVLPDSGLVEVWKLSSVIQQFEP